MLFGKAVGIAEKEVLNKGEREALVQEPLPKLLVVADLLNFGNRFAAVKVAAEGKTIFGALFEKIIDLSEQVVDRRVAVFF